MDRTNCYIVEYFVSIENVGFGLYFRYCYILVPSLISITVKKGIIFFFHWLMDHTLVTENLVVTDERVVCIHWHI